MNIISVIPLSRSKVAEELSYFTSSQIPVGAIVSVPIKRKNIYAIVTKIEPALEMKSAIKKAPFEIRKLGKVKASAFFPPEFIGVAKSLAEYYASTTGAILDASLSNLILNNAQKIVAPLPNQGELNMPLKDFAYDRNRVYAIQADDTDRFSSWRSLIRQEFANRRSLVFYLPTIEDCNRLYRELEKGLEEYIFILHSNISAKKFTERWNSIANIDHPVVIIATASFPILPREDIKTVIVERENARGWISQKSPYIDLRKVIKDISTFNKQNLYLSDSLLSIETLYNIEKENIDEGSTFKWRSISLAKDSLIDMRLPKNTSRIEDTDTDFVVLSKELKSIIQNLAQENTSLFIYATRRGLSPISVCQDCGNVVECRQCKTTVVLHKSEETGKNFFMCHICGDRRSADENCKVCDSWKLASFGIGIDRIAEEIKNFFPEIDVVQIDSDKIKTEKQMRDALEKFRSKPGKILLGTELAFQNFSDKVDNIAIVSLDSLFSLPDYRISEKIMYTLVRLRAQATRTFLIQSRQAEQKVLELGLKGNLSDFFRTTIDNRKRFDYPPFSLLIKITIEGKKESIANTMADVARLLAPHELDIFPAFTAAIRGRSVIHGLMRIPAQAWPKADLISKLRSLPPNVFVKIGPESLL